MVGPYFTLHVAVQNDGHGTLVGQCTTHHRTEFPVVDPLCAQTGLQFVEKLFIQLHCQMALLCVMEVWFGSFLCLSVQCELRHAEDFALDIADVSFPKLSWILNGFKKSQCQDFVRQLLDVFFRVVGTDTH